MFKFVSLIPLLAAFACLPENPGSASKEDFAQIRAQRNPTPIEIDLKDTVFQSYYADYVTRLGPDFEALSYDDFVSNYYSQEANIADYVASLGQNHGLPMSMQEMGSPVDLNSSSGGDGYFLSNTKDQIITAGMFQKGAPLYSGFGYANLHDGDIFVEFAGGHLRHVGLINDASKPISGFDGISTYVSVIEAVLDGGVRYSYLDDERILRNEICIYRYLDYFDEVDYSNIIYFANEQIGDDYYLPADVLLSEAKTSINSTSWYCGELVRAAYLYEGIELFPDYISGLVWGGDLDSNDDLMKVNLTNRFLLLTLTSKAGNTWNLYIFNFTTSQRSVSYNSKMCFEDDAKYWLNLHHVIGPTTIGINSYLHVSIEENGWARYITASYEETIGESNLRYVTYANELDPNELTLSMAYNIIREEA